MSAAVRIRKLHAEHRASDDAGLQRCQAVQRQWLDGELEAALDRVAAPDELVLVRRLQADLTLVPTRTDGENARAWGDELAAALERTLRRAAPDQVLRFAGRRQAMQAFVRDAIAGDDSRDWAWQRLGLLPATPASVSPAQRQGRLMALLADDANHGVPLLRGLIDTPAWPALLAALSDGELRGLAASVLARITERASAAFDDAPTWLAELATAPATHQSALLEAWQAAGTSTRRLAALRLACMLAQPARARRGAAAVDAALRELLAPAAEGSSPEAADVSASGAPGRAADRPHDASPDALHGTGPGLTRQPSQPGAKPLTQARTPDDRAQRSTTDESPAVAPAPAVVPEGRTEWGGLLLLLPLLPTCGALALLEDETCWPSLPLALHHLARQLLPIAADDAAALAFCGLMPGDDPPMGDRAPTPAQAAALDSAVALLTAALAERLPDWRGAGLVERVARRRARVVAEPGWFEIVFALRDVSLELRRAALDLDPGFIPWLGLVLRYRYE